MGKNEFRRKYKIQDWFTEEDKLEEMAIYAQIDKVMTKHRFKILAIKEENYLNANEYQKITNNLKVKVICDFTKMFAGHTRFRIAVIANAIEADGNDYTNYFIETDCYYFDRVDDLLEGLLKAVGLKDDE